MGILESLAPLLVSLGKIVVDYATANAEKRAELIAQADADYAKCKATILGLAAAVSDADAAADAIADAKPSAVVAAAEHVEQPAGPNPVPLAEEETTKP